MQRIPSDDPQVLELGWLKITWAYMGGALKDLVDEERFHTSQFQ